MFNLALSRIFTIFVAKLKTKIMNNLIGRIEEISIINSLLTSSKSEFLAVYGRRRVGKTFLIRNVFKNKMTFQISGIANASLKQQLTNFQIELQKVMPKKNIQLATNWFEAFQQLIHYLENVKQQRKVIFIDELPWFDTRNSKFIQALEHFWNSWASARKDILLVVCGSSTSWMLNKLINNKGGLHNRITKRLKILPFTLQECKLLLDSKKIVLDKYQIIQLYMVLGGIPFYWDEIKAGWSAMQNIEKICFSENGLLQTEFQNLFSSLFVNAKPYLLVISALAKKSKGLTREEIIEYSGLPNAGSTTRILTELEESGFIKKYVPFGKKARNSLYQLVDFYTLFYFKFIKDEPSTDKNTWLNMIDNPKYRAWSGYAYEQVCFYHLPQIKKALGISGVQTSVSSWISSADKSKVQIDMVINRRDHVINICEIKFSINPFTITQKYADELRDKIGLFRSETKTKKSVFLTMLTTFGLQQNAHSQSVVQNEIDMNALFE